MVSAGRTSPPARPVVTTRYRCGFPGCCKRYASTDGVRKHARKTHLAWLKSVDENAGSRDRHLESKPSTYCVKEEGYAFDDDVEVEEASPSLSPTGISPVLSGLRMGEAGPSGLGSISPAPLNLPEPATHGLGGASAREASVRAAAAAAALVGAGEPPPPLAWLLAQSAMGIVPPPPVAHDGPTHATPVCLPVPLAPMPPWLAASLSDANATLPPPVLGGSDPRLGHHLGLDPRLYLDPLPSPPPLGDLSALFGNIISQQPVAVGVADDAALGADPLCLTPPSASAISSACVSPFELEKRPKNAPPQPPKPAQPEPPKTAVELSPTSTTAGLFDPDEPDELIPGMPDSEYRQFVEALLA